MTTSDLSPVRRARHEGTARLVARALLRHGEDADRVVAAAWDAALPAGSDVGDEVAVRSRLLTEVVRACAAAGGLADDAVDESLGERDLFPDGHRWARWRADDPALWDLPAGMPAPLVVAAVRRLPVRERLVLVLRDAAGLGYESVAAVVPGMPLEQNALLDRGRTYLVAAVDAVLNEEP